MAYVKFNPPLEWCDKTYEGVETDDVLKLRGKDRRAVLSQLKQQKIPVLNPETDDEFLLALLARAARIPVEAFDELPVRVYTELKQETQGSLLGSEEPATPPSAS